MLNECGYVAPFGIISGLLAARFQHKASLEATPNLRHCAWLPHARLGKL